MGEYDRHDLALLGLLQADALQTAEQLAEHVPLSPSAIARRVRRMRDDGTIRANVAELSERIGPFLSAIVDVQLDRHALPDLERLLRKLTNSPHVQALLEVTGAADLMLLVVVRDMEAYNQFADDVLAGDPVVRRYETRFIKKRRKYSTALPIAVDA
ncbi:MAG: Lrp/AsnC family transcriptional regulator [Asticcacaulis sp.]